MRSVLWVSLLVACGTGSNATPLFLEASGTYGPAVFASAATAPNQDWLIRVMFDSEPVVVNDFANGFQIGPAENSGVEYYLNGVLTDIGTDTFVSFSIAPPLVSLLLDEYIFIFWTSDPPWFTGPTSSPVIQTGSRALTANANLIYIPFGGSVESTLLTGMVEIAEVPVPEPSPAGMIVLGGLALACWRLRPRSRYAP